MPPKTKIFITGATGYIGGTVLQRLWQHHTFPKSEITALVRDGTKLSLFASIGVKTLHGELDDVEQLERLASETDVVFACADYDHVRSYEAILRGFKRRHQLTGTVPIFFQTSGTDVVDDDTQGMRASETIFDDMDLEQLKRVLVNHPPRRTDALLLEADRQGYVRAHIILAAMVYGFGSGPLIDRGIGYPYTTELPDLVEACIRRRHAGMMGLGLNIMSHVHLDDLGDMYTALYDAILDGRADHGLEGMYFAANGECSARAISERIGKALVEFGVCRPGEQAPTPFDEWDFARQGEQVDLTEYGGNTRCRANRARMLGWKPKNTTEDLLKHVRRVVQWELKQKTNVRVS